MLEDPYADTAARSVAASAAGRPVFLGGDNRVRSMDLASANPTNAASASVGNRPPLDRDAIIMSAFLTGLRLAMFNAVLDAMIEAGDVESPEGITPYCCGTGQEKGVSFIS